MHRFIALQRHENTGAWATILSGYSGRPESELFETLALYNCVHPLRLIADRCIVALACVTDAGAQVIPMKARIAVRV